jgi:hypothetical protein
MDGQLGAARDGMGSQLAAAREEMGGRLHRGDEKAPPNHVGSLLLLGLKINIDKIIHCPKNGNLINFVGCIGLPVSISRPIKMQILI